MPRYFFDLDDHIRDIDDEGAIMDGPATARMEAVTFAGAYLRDNPHLIDDGVRFTVTVRDEAQETVVKIVIHTEDERADAAMPSA